METTFAQRLRSARQRAKLSQDSLADRANTTKTSISQWETGIIQTCKTDMLFNLADVLMVNARWLATGHGDMETSKELPHHIHIAKIIDSIPEEARKPLVDLIQALGKASEERFWKWAKEVSS